MAKIRVLTARQCETLSAGFHSDGGNLYLRVSETGARSWVFRYKQSGKVTEIGIGALSTRSLKDARVLAEKMRKAITDGKDPKLSVKIKVDANAKTFSGYAKAYIAAKQSDWSNAKHAQQWENTLKQYAHPIIGDKLPVDVSLADIKAILTPIWATKTETATRLRQRIEHVLDYAAVHEDVERHNPARWRGVLNKILPDPAKLKTTKHFASAPYNEVPTIMAALRKKHTLSAYCLRFIILTASRSNEARGALWDEIDTKGKAWVIPAERMKMARAHRVPLCNEAIEILNIMQQWRQSSSNFVFPSVNGKQMSDVAMNKTLHSITPDVTVHGFRSSFRIWGADTTSLPSAALELALAHVNKDKVEAAYQRSDLFDIRVELMQAWGNYCANNDGVLPLAKTIKEMEETHAVIQELDEEPIYSRNKKYIEIDNKLRDQGERLKAISKLMKLVEGGN